MRKSWNRFKHKNLGIAATVIALALLPIILISTQQKQEDRSHAQAATTLSFSPVTTSSTPLLKKVGDNFPLNVVISPGTNLVSFLKLEVLYDPSKVPLSQ